MALIDCLECGNKISDQAPTCPHCGFPQKQIQTSISAFSQKEATRNNVKSSSSIVSAIGGLACLIAGIAAMVVFDNSLSAICFFIASLLSFIKAFKNANFTSDSE